MEGSAILARQYLDKAIPYKYVFCAKGSDDYEFIYKQQKQREHVNRCLQVQAKLLGPGRPVPAAQPPSAPRPPCPREGWVRCFGQRGAEDGRPQWDGPRWLPGVCPEVAARVQAIGGDCPGGAGALSMESAVVVYPC